MDKKKKKNGLSYVQNILFTILIILIFLGIICIFYILLNRETKDNIIKNGQLNAVSSAGKIDTYLSKGDDIIKLTGFTLDNMIRENRTSGEMLDYIVNQTKAALNILPGESNGIYAYIKGDYLDGVGWVPDDDYVPTERPWYIEAVKGNGNVVVVDPYLDAQTGTTMITLAKTLCDGESVVAIDFSLEQLQSIAEQIVAESESDMEIILDGDYQVIAHSDKNEVGKNYKEEKGSLGSVIAGDIAKSKDNYFPVDYDGIQYLVYKVKVQNDWLSLSVTDATSVFTRMRIPLAFTILASMLIVTVLLIILIRLNKKGILAEKMKELAELRSKYAYQDQMTGIKNRRAYAEKLNAMAEGMPEGLCLVILDVNGLKTVNDTCGHEAGDELLIAAASSIKKSFDGTDDIFRLGGDEFSVITIDSVEEVEKRLKNLDEITHNYNGKLIKGFSISYGVCSSKEKNDIDQVEKTADTRMYEYKENYYITSGIDRRRKK